MPPQVTRLVYLTIAIVVSYFVARWFLVPSSFGQYGWYRGDALREISALPTSYAGRGTCAGCHDELADKLGKGPHKGISCESCHGPAGAHVEDPSLAPAKIMDPRFCLRCHSFNPARPVKFPQVEIEDHFPDQKCAECHVPHSPREVPKVAPKEVPQSATKGAPKK